MLKSLYANFEQGACVKKCSEKRQEANFKIPDQEGLSPLLGLHPH